MNRKNKIFFVILAFIVSIMIGYALFSETVTVSGTATAQGQFGISASCTPGVSKEYEPVLDIDVENDIPQGGYENDFCVATGNTVNFGSHLLYPTAARYFTVKITNTGTINAVVDPENNGVELNEGELCYDADDDGVYDECYTDKYALRYMSLTYILEDTFIVVDADGQVPDEEEFIRDDGAIVIKPNYSLMIIVLTQWPEDLDVNNVTMEHRNVSIKFNFVQETVN